MKPARFAVILTVALSSILLLAATPTPDLAKRFEADIRVLAADDMEGRGLGTKGIAKAADWIEARLRAIGLEPAFNGSYRQPVKVKTGVALGDGNRLAGLAEGDWAPLGFSSSGTFSGPLVFAGYGIQAPPLGYNELDGIDLKGKVAIMLRYEPQEKDDASIFDGRRPSRWSSLRYKVLQARERGALAVIFVTGPFQDEGKDKVPALKNDGPESPAGIPVVQVRTSVAQRWLSAAKIDLTQFQKDVDRDLRPRSQVVAGVTIEGRVNVHNAYADTANLSGIIPGRGALADEIIVVGAHYDHLGYGGEGSMRPNVHAIHNGADDNGSGSVSVLLAAERVRDALHDVPSHRTVMFALFTGEESGLAGSAWLVDHFPRPLERVVAMVNLDMVGQLRDNQLIALGSDSAPEWKPLLERDAAAIGLKVSPHGDGYGPSDQTSFYAKHVPVIHFFTGTHDRYHSPDDRPETLNFAGAATVIEMTARVAAHLADGSVTPKYARAVTAPAMQGDSRGYGAYLGTVPDYRAMEADSGGVLLADVRAGGPAERAGIRGGDRIVQMAGTKIENLYDMTFALQDHKPGETIDVIVIRDGARVTLRATLGSRGDRGQAPAAPAQGQPSAAPKPTAQGQPPMPPQPAMPAVPAPAAPPAMPPAHSASAAPAEAAGFKLPEFYENRPGKDFVIKAGKPFDKTFDGEKHFKDIRQLTFGGQNAEAYFSPDGTKLIFQATPPGTKCDREFIMDLATGETKQISSGKGRTTCGYFRYPQADRIIYATTEAAGDDCPPEPDRSQGYVWGVYKSYDIWEANPDGSNARPLTTTEGYDAEATWCHRGGKFIFTSVRDGDLDLYEMDEAGQVRRLTTAVGYDGGAFYNADCTEIAFRANHPTGAALEEYRGLLARGLVRPTTMEIFVMKADGSDVRQLTHNGAANFCPYFHPDGNRIIFSSNVGDPKGREFDIWLLNKNGGEPERITTAPGFDGFPMWSPDGTLIVWASNRANPATHETNLYIARWVE